MQHITDENGRRIAAVIPMEEFAALLLDSPVAPGAGRLSPAEEKDRRQAYEELARGLALGEAMREW